MADPVPAAYVAKAHDALLHHDDIQFAMREFPRPKAPDWLIALAKFLGAHWLEIKWAFWIVAGVIVITLGVALVRAYLPVLANRRPSPKVVGAKEEWRPVAAVARQLLSESDALAARGRFGEAVHLLLLRSIEDIERRRPRAVRPTFTSREIGSLSALPDSARPAFSGIARVVERALFADGAVDAADFARCRADYEAFAFAPAWNTDGRA